MSHPPGPPPPPPGEPEPGPPGRLGDYPPPQAPPAGHPGVPTTNAKATAALATGVGSLVLSWCCGLGVVGVVAILLGVRARAEIRASGGTQEGEGLALAGIITGAVAVVVGLVVLVVIVIALVAGRGGGPTGDF